MKLEWSDQALADLDRFAEFLRRDHPSLAVVVAREIIRKAQMLSEHPLLSRIPRFPILGILEIGGIDDEEPKSGTLRKGRGGTAASPGLAASIHAK